MQNPPLKKEIGKFLGFFLVLYLIVFVVLNITGWLIRPKKIEHSLDNSSLPIAQGDELECIFSEKTDSVLIPKINIEAPLVFPESQDEKVLSKALDSGVVYYPLSSLPWQEGQIVLLGHSAPAGWPKIKYDWVFSDLNELELDDEIYLFFENCQYLYKVIGKSFLEKGEELPENLPDSQSLLLISCWPPGKDIRRIAIHASIDKIH